MMNFPVKPPEEVNANVSTSDMTHAIEMISRSKIGRSIITGMIDPPVDCVKYHGGGFCDRPSSNSAVLSFVESTAAALRTEEIKLFAVEMYCDVPQFNQTTSSEQ
jgi:hypothetical protein